MESTGRTERRPLNSRSLIASTLLGTHPPELPGKLLVELGVLFGIAPGTTRVALSRMVAAGELTLRNGRYGLAGALTNRQQRQDKSRVVADTAWDGSWEQWLIVGGARAKDDRAELRTAATTLGLAEIRDGVWMRPSNLPPDRNPEAVAVLEAQATRCTAHPADGVGLARVAWDLNGWSNTASSFVVALGRSRSVGRDQLPEAFALAAEVVRHLLHDPQLPAKLLPKDWPGNALRQSYTKHETLLQAALRDFFAEVK